MHLDKLRHNKDKYKKKKWVLKRQFTDDENIND